MGLNLLNVADLLRRQPQWFHFVRPSLRLVENELYLGAYYDLVTITPPRPPDPGRNLP